MKLSRTKTFSLFKPQTFARLGFLLVVLWCGIDLQAQPNIEWQAGFGGMQNDTLLTLQRVAAGGYLLGGHSASYVSGNKTNTNYGNLDYWLVKTDDRGQKEWEAEFGGLGDDILRNICAAGDGGYLLAGSSSGIASGNKTNGTFGLADYWLVKVDESGNKQWEQIFGGTGNDDLYNVLPATGGGYILAGSSSSGLTGNKTNANLGSSDYWLIKVDSTGDKMWEKVFGGSANDFLNQVCPSSDGGWLLLGESRSGISGNKTNANFGGTDFWLVKVDANGNKLWEKSFGGFDSDYLERLLPTGDGGCLLVGESYSVAEGEKTSVNFGGSDFWVIKVDADGNTEWEKSIGGAGEEFLKAVVATSDGGFLLGGISDSEPSGRKTAPAFGADDYWVVKIVPIRPVVVTPPQSRTNSVGTPATFNVATGGLQPVHYQWWKGGMALSGETNTSLQMGSVANGDAGDYFVVITNMAGSVTSLVATLTVTQSGAAPPAVVFGPVQAGGEFMVRYLGTPGETYTVERAESLPPMSWQKATNLVAPLTDLGFGIGVFEFREAIGPGNRFYRAVHPAY